MDLKELYLTVKNEVGTDFDLKIGKSLLDRKHSVCHGHSNCLELRIPHSEEYNLLVLEDMVRNTLLKMVWRHCQKNRIEILRSKYCSCFYCGSRSFEVQTIHKWVDEQQTACCPNCDIDSVIGDACGYNLSADLINALNTKYFSPRDNG